MQLFGEYPVGTWKLLLKSSPHTVTLQQELPLLGKNQTKVIKNYTSSPVTFQISLMIAYGVLGVK